jgi:hypothetical protein
MIPDRSFAHSGRHFSVPAPRFIGMLLLTAYPRQKWSSNVKHRIIDKRSNLLLRWTRW